jgi:hypothetical protein
VKTLKIAYKVFIVVGLILAAVNITITLWPSSTPVAVTPQGLTPFDGVVGIVTDVEPLGDNGSYVVVIDNVPVLVAGPTEDRPTVLKLRDRPLIKLIGKRVKVIGDRVINGFIAKVIEEL